jgi:MFS transporter, MHS family, proline/betaine transporter
LIFGALEESPIWRELDRTQSSSRAPLRMLFSVPHAAVLGTNVIIIAGIGVGYYLTSGFMPTFLKLVKEVPNSTASLILVAGSIVTIIAQTLAGHMSELVGRRRIFLIAGGINVVALPACYLLLGRTTDMGMIAFYSLVLAFLANAAIGPAMVFLNERFPTALRASGTSLSWNLGFALGGLAPTFVSLASGSVQGLPAMLAAFCAAGAMIYLVGAMLVPETKGKFV